MAFSTAGNWAFPDCSQMCKWFVGLRQVCLWLCIFFFFSQAELVVFWLFFFPNSSIQLVL